MSKTFAATLIGPFPMSTPPVRDGFYAVAVQGLSGHAMWCFMDGQWYDSDDGLGALMDTSSATGWFGANKAGVNVDPDDGLGV